LIIIYFSSLSTFDEDWFVPQQVEVVPAKEVLPAVDIPQIITTAPGKGPLLKRLLEQ